MVVVLVEGQEGATQDPVQPHCGSPPPSTVWHWVCVTVPPLTGQPLVCEQAAPVQLHCGSPPASSCVQAAWLVAWAEHDVA